jgi:hypothetical protein
MGDGAEEGTHNLHQLPTQESLASEESWAHKAVTPETFSNIIHLITKNTPEQV